MSKKQLVILEGAFIKIFHVFAKVQCQQSLSVLCVEQSHESFFAFSFG